MNLSVSGALIHVERSYPIGEFVEVEIDFLDRPESPTVVAGFGYIVRAGRPHTSAVHFETGCAIAHRPANDAAPHLEPSGGKPGSGHGVWASRPLHL